MNNNSVIVWTANFKKFQKNSLILYQHTFYIGKVYFFSVTCSPGSTSLNHWLTGPLAHDMSMGSWISGFLAFWLPGYLDFWSSDSAGSATSGFLLAQNDLSFFFGKNNITSIVAVFPGKTTIFHPQNFATAHYITKLVEYIGLQYGSNVTAQSGSTDLDHTAALFVIQSTAAMQEAIDAKSSEICVEKICLWFCMFKYCISVLFDYE